jgi:two-component system sensor histidine kinase YesM
MTLSRIITKLLPSQIKYRLILAFLLFILLPYTFIQLYNYENIERTIRSNIIGQNQEQLTYLKSSFEDMKVSIQNTVVLFENDPDMISILQNAAASPEDHKHIGQKFADLSKRIEFNFGVSIQFMLASQNGTLYASHIPEIMRIDPEFVGRPLVQAQLVNPYLNQWSEGNSKELLASYAPVNGKFATLTTTLKGYSESPHAVLYVFFDYTLWLKTAVSKFPVKQNYFLLSEQGVLLAQTEPAMVVSDDNIRDVLASSTIYYPISGYYDSSIISSIPLASFPWMLGCQFDLNLFLGNIQHLKQQFLLTSIALTAGFLLITFMISSLVTRPLHLLKKNMLRVADGNLRLRPLAEHPYAGEITSLTQAYNTMIEDMDELIRKLKIEERQKEALRFQMLLSQMNPHFLLNTLNTIKWIALEHEVDTIAEACVSLGTLLESSLASESELIYVKDEIELIQAYVRLQQFRYANKLDVSFDVDPTLQFALAPKFGLQPLVENAIQHGIAPLRGVGSIMIRVYSEHTRLLIEVEDNGVGIDGSRTPRTRSGSGRKGIGLINLRERLHLMFRGEAEMNLLPMAQGTLARMKLPLLLSTPYVKEGDPDVDRISR